MFWAQKMKTMKIDQLVPTHNRLRNPEKLWEAYVWQGKNSKPVVINKTDREYIQDGHHRLVLNYWTGRLILDSGEYKLAGYKNKEYNQINYAQNWVTPFDITSEVRVPNFFTFKEVALDLKSDKFITQNKWAYTEYRYVHTLSQLAELYSPEVYLRRLAETDSEKALNLPESDLYAFIRLRGTNFVIGGVTYKDDYHISSCINDWHGSTQTAMRQAETLIWYAKET